MNLVKNRNSQGVRHLPSWEQEGPRTEEARGVFCQMGKAGSPFEKGFDGELDFSSPQPLPSAVFTCYKIFFFSFSTI